MSFKPQVNLTIESGMFKNWFNVSNSITSQNGYAFWKDCNDDGFPVSMPYNYSGVFGIPSDWTTDSVLVFAWKGTIPDRMEITIGSPGATVIAGLSFVVGSTTNNISGGGTDGYIEFKVNKPGLDRLNFIYQPGNYVNLSDVFIGFASDYGTWAARTKPEDIFRSAWINVYKGLNLSTTRMLGLNNPNNGNNVTQHKYRNKWKTAMSFADTVYNNGATTTSANGIITSPDGIEYTCTKAPDCGATLTRGDVLQGIITTTSTGVPYLNDGRGRKPILYMNAGPEGAGRVGRYTFIYDDIADGWMNRQDGMTCLFPIEVCVAFCNLTNTNLWYNFPPNLRFADVTPIVQYVRDNLATGLQASFEYANEVWNPGPDFLATYQAYVCGSALGFSSSGNRHLNAWYGIIVCKIMPLVKAAWSPRSAAQLHCVLGYQGAGGGVVGGDVDIYRLRGTDLTTSIGNAKYASFVGANFNAFPNRPRDMVDVISPATYVECVQMASFDVNYNPANISGLLAAADQFAAGGASNIAAAFAFVDNDARKGTDAGGNIGSETLNSQLATRIVGWEGMAASFDGDGSPTLSVTPYEGAFQSTYPSIQRCTDIGISTTYGGPTGKIANLCNAYKDSQLFYDYCMDYYRGFSRLPHSGEPSWFQVGGGNQWSMTKQGVADVLGPMYKSADATRAVGSGVRRMIVKR